MSLVCLPRAAVERLVRLAKLTADAHEASEQPRSYVEARLERQADIVLALLRRSAPARDRRSRRRRRRR